MEKAWSECGEASWRRAGEARGKASWRRAGEVRAKASWPEAAPEATGTRGGSDLRRQRPEAAATRGGSDPRRKAATRGGSDMRRHLSCSITRRQRPEAAPATRGGTPSGCDTKRQHPEAAAAPEWAAAAVWCVRWLLDVRSRPSRVCPCKTKCRVPEVVIFLCMHGLKAECMPVHPSHFPLHTLCSWYDPRIVLQWL